MESFYAGHEFTVVAPNGKFVAFVATADPLTPNICFGGEDMRDAFVTLPGSGRVVRIKWEGV